jgi:hypothetical protein
MVITKNNLKAEIDNVDDQYLEVLYQLIKKLPVQQKKIQLISLILKRFFLISLKQMDWKLNGNGIIQRMYRFEVLIGHLFCFRINQDEIGTVI